MFEDAGRGVQAKREPDGRDWEEIVHLLEIVSRESLKKMTKSQLVGTVLDLLAITSQLQAEKEKQFKVAVENILNRNCQSGQEESKRHAQIEKDKAWCVTLPLRPLHSKVGFSDLDRFYPPSFLPPTHHAGLKRGKSFCREVLFRTRMLQAKKNYVTGKGESRCRGVTQACPPRPRPSRRGRRLPFGAHWSSRKAPGSPRLHSR